MNAPTSFLISLFSLSTSSRAFVVPFQSHLPGLAEHFLSPPFVHLFAGYHTLRITLSSPWFARIYFHQLLSPILFYLIITEAQQSGSPLCRFFLSRWSLFGSSWGFSCSSARLTPLSHSNCQTPGLEPQFPVTNIASTQSPLQTLIPLRGRILSGASVSQFYGYPQDRLGRHPLPTL